MAASALYDATPHGRVLLTKWVRRRVMERFAISLKTGDAAATVLHSAWRASAAAVWTRLLKEQETSGSLQLPAQLLRNHWAKKLGERAAEIFTCMAAHLADKNTRVGCARIFDNHATVLQRAWRASAAAAAWRARSHAVMHIQRAWRTARGLGPAKPRRRKPRSAKHARAQKARARAPPGGRA